MYRTATLARPAAVLVAAAALLTGLLVAVPAEAARDDACPAAFTDHSPFSDVALSSTHGLTIACMAGWNAASPITGSQFRPAEVATRGQFAVMLHRLLVGADKAPAYSSRYRFTDVPVGHPQGPEIVALAEAGVISGTTATTFAPDRAITRGQMAALIVRSYRDVFGATMPLGTAFKDITGTTHEDTIRRLVGAKITQGFADGTYRPNAPITRAQMATFHANYADLFVREGRAGRPDAPVASVCSALKDPTFTVREAMFSALDLAGLRFATISGHTAGSSCRVTDPALTGTALEVKQVTWDTFERRAAAAGQTGRVVQDSDASTRSPAIRDGMRYYGTDAPNLRAGTYEWGFVVGGHAYQMTYQEAGTFCFACGGIVDSLTMVDQMAVSLAP